MLTQEYLKSRLRYDPETGHFTWISELARWSGKRAGSSDSAGYIAIEIDGRGYKAHRLAWLYVHGRMPADQLDHINRDKADNRIENLRECTHAENCMNRVRKRPCGLPSGVHRSGKRFQALIRVNGVLRSLGCYDTPDEASDVYQKARIEEFGEFA